MLAILMLTSRARGCGLFSNRTARLDIKELNCASIRYSAFVNLAISVSSSDQQPNGGALRLEIDRANVTGCIFWNCRLLGTLGDGGAIWTGNTALRLEGSCGGECDCRGRGAYTIQTV
jgi:hypothetical protein